MSQEVKKPFDELAFRRMCQAQKAVECGATSEENALSAIGAALAASSGMERDPLKGSPDTEHNVRRVAAFPETSLEKYGLKRTNSL